MIFRSYSQWIIVVLCGYFLLCISTDDCSRKCRVIGGRYSFGNKVGPPKLKWVFTKRNIVLNHRVEIQCPLCQSNPPSTMTWLFRKRPLMKNVTKIKTSCGQKLFLQIRSKQDAGNYTCVVKNNLGSTNATTQVVLADDRSYPPVDIKRQGNITGNDVRVGEPLNITCFQVYPACRITWFKNNKVFKGTSDGRIKLVKKQSKPGYEMRKCSLTIDIRNVTAKDTGSYTCTSNMLNSTTTTVINAVPCFQGYYCPSIAAAPQRCPEGKFSLRKNATSVHHCDPCPTDEKDDIIESGLKGKTAEIFRKNCGGRAAVKDLRKTSSLSTGEKIAIGISVVVFVAGTAAVVCYLKICRKQKYLSDHLIGIVELPSVPISNDVFICYSSKNKTWVLDTLRTNLEAQDFQLCIDVRDFEGGVDICDNIANAIYGSKKTIFVLSEDSLKSYDARVELRQALVADKLTGREVIVILFEKCQVPRDISDTKIYLDWTDEKNREIFWEKLYRAVSRPCQMK